MKVRIPPPLLVTSLFLGSVCISLIDLHSLDSEHLDVKVHKGYFLSTSIISVLSGHRVRRVKDGCCVVWRGSDSEKLVEVWLHEKLEKHLLVDILVVDDSGEPRGYSYAFFEYRWAPISPLQFHTLLRSLILNSTPVSEMDPDHPSSQDYDPYFEFNRIYRMFHFSHSLGRELMPSQGSLDSLPDQPRPSQSSPFCNFCCSITSCFM